MEINIDTNVDVDNESFTKQINELTLDALVANNIEIYSEEEYKKIMDESEKKLASFYPIENSYKQAIRFDSMWKLLFAIYNQNDLDRFLYAINRLPISAMNVITRNPAIFSFEVFAHRLRDVYISQVSWAIPSKEVIDEIYNRTVVNNVKSKILEVGAGNGFWAYLLERRGCKVFATDDFSSKLIDFQKTFFSVEKISAVKAVQKYNPHASVLMMIWAPYGSSMAYDALMEFNGNMFIYIGEMKGGMCADDAFFDELSKNWIEETLPQNCKLLTWNGINDCFKIFRRNINFA